VSNKYKGLAAVLSRVIVVALVLSSAIPTMSWAQEAGYMVKPGDGLEISVWKEPDLQGPVLVTPDGSFSFPLVGQVDARGKTV
jgi:polysaccharide export outer membrane protein